MSTKEPRMTGKEKWEERVRYLEELEKAEARWKESESILSILRTPKGTEPPITDEEILKWNRA